MEYMDETTLAHKHTSPWLIAFRIIFTIALVWCILFIFHNSLETSSISSARSHEVMQKINAILAHLNIGPLSEHVVRKLAHFSEFTLEGFLLMLCLRVYTRRFVRHVSWPMLGGMATAPYTGTAIPTVGWCALSANGTGGVTADSGNGNKLLVVDVDTAGKTVTFVL